ncbi:MAG: stage 0 sporulation family protein [Oscillospiraceae bacterium]
MKKIISVRFKPTGKTYYFDPGALQVEAGAYVIVETARGCECGEVVRGVHAIPEAVVPKDLKPVVRVADDADIRRMKQNREDEKEAFRLCEERIEKHALPMKLIDVEFTHTRNKILFYFTADGRVDFRELVKDLAGVFRTRIELKQIGVRDESKMLGGLGICGQPFCCSRFLKTFQPVSIKMAKEQGLSLNPTKISGSCGRLMCCLGYEQSAYEYLGKITPMVNSVVKTPDGLGTVTEVNLVSGMLRVRLDKSAEQLVPKYYHRDQCEYIRGGKRAPVTPEQAEPRQGKADQKKSGKKDDTAEGPAASV